MNSNQMNEEHLPKPQKTKEKNNRFTALKIMLVIPLIAIVLLEAVGFAAGAEWIKISLGIVSGIAFVILLVNFVRVKRKREDKKK